MSDLNLFMVCEKLNREALRELPAGFTVSRCRPDELDIWKAFPFNSRELAEQYHGYMTDYFKNAYAENETAFYERCVFIRDGAGKPVATAFTWESYPGVWCLHWVKVLKGYEGFGLGRALLSAVLGNEPTEHFPIYLHTQPSSFRAIKLYTDFGFSFLTDPVVGYRENHLKAAMEELERVMTPKAFAGLSFKAASEKFLAAARTRKESVF